MRKSLRREEATDDRRTEEKNKRAEARRLGI